LVGAIGARFQMVWPNGLALCNALALLQQDDLSGGIAMQGKDDDKFLSPGDKLKREMRKANPLQAAMDELGGPQASLIREALKQSSAGQMSGSSVSGSSTSFPSSSMFPVSPEQLASGAAQSAPASETSPSEEMDNRTSRSLAHYSIASKELIIDLLKQGEASIPDILEAFNNFGMEISPVHLYVMLKRMTQAGLINREGRGRYSMASPTPEHNVGKDRETPVNKSSAATSLPPKAAAKTNSRAGKTSKAEPLGLGARGTWVENLQRQLTTLELYKDNIDGYFGPGTASALTTFQVKRGLPATGVLTEETKDALDLNVVLALLSQADPTSSTEISNTNFAAAKAVQEPTRFRRILPGFSTDRPVNDDKDPLAIASDVEAMAGIICMEKARPPLSIGLFGDWGSGKSTFMERMQTRIADIASQEKQRRDANKDNGQIDLADTPRFIADVVQIRFNAWHYADANLWASLTAEFFDQLRRGGYEGGQASDYKALIGKVAERVKSLESGAVKAQDALNDAARTARDAEAALKTAREKRDASDLALASEQLAKDFKKIRDDKGNEAKLKEVGRRIYRDDVAKDLDTFTAMVAEAASIPGKIALIARVMIGGGWRAWTTWLGIAAIVLVAVLGIGWRMGDETSLAVLAQRIIGWGGGSFAALGAIWQAVKTAKPILDGAFAYAKAVETARKELAKEVEAREVAARDAARALDAARTALDSAKKPLDKYGDSDKEAPGTILRYFLFEDGDVRDYDKQVGIVSRARRSFAQLDSIASTARAACLAKEKKDRGETLSEADEAALKHFASIQGNPDSKDKKASTLTVPDRIVLYIDDLDRCTHEQVYAVLQAIHLLLAFELFVVVVGVDVEWVTDAVARQFAHDSNPLSLATATDEARETLRKEEDDKRRARAINYLEKIFQVPFWLQKLTIQNASASGGTYGDYIRGLLATNTPPTVTQSDDAQSDNVQEQPNGPGTASNLATQSPSAKSRKSKGADTVLLPDSGKGKDTAKPDAAQASLKAGDHPSTARTARDAEATLAALQLTSAEIDFLASPEIGALAAKSPRAVKRLVNVYRIVRGRLSPDELRSFLGEDGATPQWPMAAVLVAIETGQKMQVAEDFYKGLKLSPGYEKLSDSIMGGGASTLNDPNTDTKGSGALMLAEADIGSGHMLGAALSTMRIAMGYDNNRPGPRLDELLAIARIVRRYSFNRYE
jgi:predicted DCC family thiol-disulfide oxidoreductase YuxK